MAHSGNATIEAIETQLAELRKMDLPALGELAVQSKEAGDRSKSDLIALAAILSQMGYRVAGFGEISEYPPDVRKAALENREGSFRFADEARQIYQFATGQCAELPFLEQSRQQG